MNPLLEIDALLFDDAPGDAPLVTAAELGDWLGLTANRVHALARQGAIPRDPSGRFPLRPAVRAYAEHLRRTSSSRGSADPAYVAAKTRTAEATAEKIETANRLARGDLLPAAAVEKEWAGILRGVRAAVLALPGRVAQRLGHLSSTDLAAIDREARDLLEELANDD